MDIGGIRIEFLGHSGFMISFLVCDLDGNNCVGKKMLIDPYGISKDIEKVDYVLITHGHFDHCSLADIKKVVKPGTIMLVTPDAQSKIAKLEGVEVHVVVPGDEFSVGNMKIEAISAYNTNKFRNAEKRQVFHSKNEGFVGYVIKAGNTIIYHSGDSDIIPEMQKLSGYGKHGNNFICLLPVSGTYVMTPDEAAEAASLLNPDLAIPMHYGAGVIGDLKDAKLFVKLCEEKGINAKILEKI